MSWKNTSIMAHIVSSLISIIFKTGVTNGTFLTSFFNFVFDNNYRYEEKTVKL